MIALSPLDMYARLLQIEHDYTKNLTASNFARTVHTLHPVTYRQFCLKEECLDNSRENVKSIMEYLVCPDCKSELDTQSRFDIHMVLQI